MECTIESFSYGEKDATRDMYYTISLKEYKRPKVTSVTSGAQLSTRATKSSDTGSGGTYTVKSGDCLWSIAKQYYGNGAEYPKIYEANKDKIKANYIIYAGQVLTIP